MFQFFLSGERLSIANNANIISPESRKRRARRLTLSIENKDAQKEKDKLRKKRSRDNESTDEHAMRKEKDKSRKKTENKDKDAQKEKDKLRKKTIRDNESTDEHVMRSKKNREHMSIFRQDESTDEHVMRNKKNREHMSIFRQDVSPDASTVRKIIDKTSKKRKRQSCQQDAVNVHDDKEMKCSVERAIKEAKHILHRTQNNQVPHSHRAIVCIICDCFIIGIETIRKLKIDQIAKHRERLSVKKYEEYYGQALKAEVIKQYQVNIEGLKELLLSPRSRRYHDGFATCACCYKGMSSNKATKTSPPKFAIANGFVIGSLPQVLQWTDKDGNERIRKIEDSELTDLLKAMLSPVRPYGYIFAYTGGSQKSIQGNFQFFELDHNRLGAVIAHLNQAGISEHIYVVICGRMTIEQKQIVRLRAKIDTQLFIDILTWFVKESGHPGYSNTLIPEECPQPLFVEDKETNNNTDKSENIDTETNIESGTFHFSSAQDPTENTSVFDSSEKFTIAMLNRSSPHLLVAGGSFANNKEMKVEDVLPFAFPFGIGGPKMKRKLKVSPQKCIQHYMRLSLVQFQVSSTILVLNHLLNRLLSYNTGVMTCRANINGVSLGETLSTLTIEELEKIKDNKTDHLNQKTKEFLKAITTTSKASGHTDAAAKFARRNAISMLSQFGLNSLFLTTTPCDECSFRVRLLCNPQQWVSSFIMPDFLILKIVQKV